MTDKQAKFIAEYLKDFNATKAAIRAGYSVDTAYTIGWENLRKPEIKEAIEKAKKRFASDADSIVYANIAYWMSVRDDEEESHGARLKASEMLGKYASMFTDRVEHSGGLEITSLTDAEIDARIKRLESSG